MEAFTSPALAGSSQPFSAPGWGWEMKLDGQRTLVRKSGDSVRIWSRQGHDHTAKYPEVVAAVAALPVHECHLDGEIAVPDREGYPNYRLTVQRRGEGARSADRLPVVYYVFDLLSLEGEDLRPKSLRDRKAALRGLLEGRDPPLRLVDYVETDGRELWKRLTESPHPGFEGLVAKRLGSPYPRGRSADWLKVKLFTTEDYAVVGFTQKQGRDQELSTIIVASYDPDSGDYVYRGRVTVGTADDRETWMAFLRSRPEGPDLRRDLRRENPTWTQPSAVVEVSAFCKTREGRLRHPSLVRIRDDKRPQDCVNTHLEAA